MIGTKKIVNGGILYTPDQTEQGYVFKDYGAIEKKEGICYIAEAGFSDCEDGTLLLTPDNTWEHIDAGGVVTYSSAWQQVEDFFHSLFPNSSINYDLYTEFIENITDYVFQEVDWQCFSTMLYEMDLEEELECFLQEKFTEFAKKRLKEDGDGTTYNSDNELFYKFADYFSGYFYRNDDYSLTDWDRLIDRWEDEPNY